MKYNIRKINKKYYQIININIVIGPNPQFKNFINMIII